MLSSYLNSLIGKLFKIIPLKEESSKEDFHAYVDSLWIEMSGACKTFPVLWDSPKYITLLNIVGFMSMNDVELSRCRREVFQAIDIVKKIQNGGGSHD